MPNLSKLEQLRQQFPLLTQKANDKPLVYFDNAATTQKPNCVIESVEQYYRSYNANVHRASHALSAAATQAFEQARSCVANYINASCSEEIVWTRGTTEAINLVAQSWGQSLKPGEEILLSSLEHHANIVPWQLLAQRSGAVIKVIPLLENGELDLSTLPQLLNKKTRLVAITHASNALGTINPVAEIIQQAHQVGAKVLVDGAQALPHFRVDVQALGADFYVFSGHKVFAPTGIGVLWAKHEVLEAMPPWQGGGEMIERVSFDGSSYQKAPFKFEAGTPNIAGVLGLATAINWLTEQDHQLLHDQEHSLLQQFISGSKNIAGLQLVGAPEQRVSLASFIMPKLHQQDIGILLDQNGIAVRSGHHCAMPLMQTLGLNGTTRASFAFYNTAAEVDFLLQNLEQLSRHETTVVAVSELKAAENNIERLSKIKDWNGRYREILLLGKRFPAMPVGQKVDENLVKGCESQTWLLAEQKENGRFHFVMDSEARIIRGLLALVQELFQDKTASEIAEIDANAVFQQLDLERHLSPSRGNGLRAAVEKIYQIAQQQSPER